MNIKLNAIILALTFSIVIKFTAFPQTSSLNKQNQLFLELAGNGLIYSFNYERLLTENFSLRAGFGFTPGFILVEGTFIQVPLNANYLVGNNNSKFESGLGVTLFSGTDAEFLGLPADDISILFITGILGYRYVSDSGFVFRIFFSPLYSDDTDPNLIPYGGISFGFMF